ncbi:LapA family protein [Sphaerisporangium dianthi]|uniref:Lipopolysaccharide assembly LapA domain-containing protein n=1 Tax=Sphaerisporangium dianthi TaxID=1436120 RepID=A0ABV9CTN7_9ACTN
MSVRQPPATPTGLDTAEAAAAPPPQGDAPPPQHDAPLPQGGAQPPAKAGTVPRTRTGTVWAGIWTAAGVFVALMVFMLQNTGDVEISFFALHGTLPLAMALLIAMVGGILLTLVVGTARITQLRRLVHRRRG